MTDLSVPAERGPAAMSLAAAGDIGFGPTGMELTPQTLAEVVAFSKLMCTAQHAIPAHLRDNPGACMAVTLDAMHLRMSPFSLARKSYKVNDVIAYEAQVVAAAINTAPITLRRPTITHAGDGPTRQCTVILHLRDGDTDPVTSPQIQNIKVQNSPLWKSDPDQQLAYYTIRSAGRRHCPEVMLGMLTREEAEAAEPLAVHEPQTSGVAARLAAAQTSETEAAGFNVRGAGDAIDDAKANADPKPKRASKKDKVDKGQDEVGNPDAEFPTTAVEPIEGKVLGEPETAGAQAAAAEPDSPASATIAPSDTQEETSGATASDEPLAESEPVADAIQITYTDITNGRPAFGQTYAMVGEPLREDGRVQTYRDGAKWSSLAVGEDGSAKVSAFSEHWSREPAAEKEADADLLPEGQPFGVKSRIAGPAPAGETYILHRAVPGYDGWVATFKDGVAAGKSGALLLNTYEEHPGKPAPGPFAAFWEALQAAPNWGAIIPVVTGLYRTTEFRAFDGPTQRQMRAEVWLEIEAKEIEVDTAWEPIAFRLWLDTQDEEAAVPVIDEKFQELQTHPAFKGYSDESQASLIAVVDAALERLQAGS